MSGEQEKAPIGLEVSKKGKISCLIVLAVLAVGFYVLGQALKVRGNESALEASMRLYSMAKAKDFLATKALATDSVTLTLQEAQKVNGDVSDYKVVRSSTQILGRPSEVHMEVTRKGKAYIAVLGLLDSHRVAVLIEYPKEDWEAKREDRAIRVIAE